MRSETERTHDQAQDDDSAVLRTDDVVGEETNGLNQCLRRIAKEDQEDRCLWRAYFGTACGRCTTAQVETKYDA
jgi:hypothetical protein